MLVEARADRQRAAAEREAQRLADEAAREERRRVDEANRREWHLQVTAQNEAIRALLMQLANNSGRIDRLEAS
ncbi:MAG: hypothetical protein ACFB16_08275 [Phormidesmis sp.]